MAGTLFVVATPIGNLEDLTFRALRTLKEVDLIAAEDTRRTAKLLAHYGIKKRMVSVREHNEARETPRLLSLLEHGASIALVSDAGTPGVADPGARVVAAARQRGLAVVPIPGASAIVTALSASGINADEFVFLGFPPPAGPKRSGWFQRLSQESRPVVFFEAPHRIRRTLVDLTELSINRPIVAFKELTKLHESVVIRQNNDEFNAFNTSGEFTVIVSGTDDGHITPEINMIEAVALFERLTNNSSFSYDEAIEIVASRMNVPIQTIRKTLKRARIAAKQRQQRSP